MFDIDIYNRKDLQIDDFQFLLAFKELGQPVFFRMAQDSTKAFAKSENCLMLDTEEEYEFMRMVFKRYQGKGCGIFFVVNNGGQRSKDITSLTAHFGDADFGKEVTGFDENGKKIIKYRTDDEIEKSKQDFLIQLKQFEIEPSIIVETKNGFHFYWLLKKENQDLSLFKPIQKAIINKFNTDPNIVDLNRILRIPNYLHLKDPSNPFRIKCIKFDSHLRYTQHEIADALQCDLQIIQNNISKKIEANIKENKVLEEKCKPSVLKEVTDIVVLKEWENKEFNTIEDIVDYLRRQDMGEVLGIKSEPNVAFRCIFHDDNHPSAVITNKQGVYKYFCNSPICKFHNENGFDIIDIVCKMKSISFIEAVKYLCQKFSIEMPDERWKKSQEHKYIQNLNSLFNKSFLQQYKGLNKTIRWGIRVLAEINQIGLENITFDKFSLDGQNVFFFSNRYLAGRLGMNVKQANQYINLFCALKLINKVPKEDVPEALLDNAKEIAKKQGQRMINFYTVPSLGEVIQKSDEMANKMLKKGYSSIKTVSKVLIENIYDKQVAGDIYKDCESSSFTRKVQDLIESYVVEEIMKKGYVILDDIYAKQIVIDGEIVEKETKYINYKRLIPALIDKYDFEYRKANKELLQRFGLKGYSYVLYKKIA